jgi:uncharacterized membrane protein YfcA
VFTLEVAGQAVWLPGVALLGVAVGYVAGMFGVGGGFLLTPLLVVVFRLPLPVAVGTGLCQIVGTATAALLRHRRVGQGEARFDLLLIPGSVVGVHAGARALAALGGTAFAAIVVDLCYIALLLGAAAQFFREGGAGFEPADYVRSAPLARLRLGPTLALPSAQIGEVSALVVAYIGLALGFLSGLLGIGGGVALMPVLVYGFGFPLRQAAGTGILALLATSSVGTAIHATQGHVHLGLAALLLVGSTVSAQLGAMATRRLPARKLRRAFSFVVLATVAAVAWDLVRRLG